MEATIETNAFSFIDKLFGLLDKLAAPVKITQFPRHYHIISVDIINGEAVYLIFDFDKKSKYTVHPK